MLVQQIGSRGAGLDTLEEVEGAIDLVTSHRIQSDALAGGLALVLFRPDLAPAIREGVFDSASTDEDIINLILEQRFSEFCSAQLVHAILDGEFVTDLYGGNTNTIKRMLDSPSYSESEGSGNAWEELKSTMTLGVSSLALVKWEGEGATTRAREIVGSHKDLELRAKGLGGDLRGIRPELAKSCRNNLVHASDSPEDLLGELSAFNEFLKRFQAGERYQY